MLHAAAVAVLEESGYEPVRKKDGEKNHLNILAHKRRFRYELVV